jgi:hypothetical protein
MLKGNCRRLRLECSGAEKSGRVLLKRLRVSRGS